MAFTTENQMWLFLLIRLRVIHSHRLGFTNPRVCQGDVTARTLPNAVLGSSTEKLTFFLFVCGKLKLKN